jgi:propanol-preferring alcohol dehydrogenase
MMPAPYPMSPGHEVVGKVVAHGKDVDQKLWPEGKKVGAGWNGGYCHHCKSCRKGDFIHCELGRVTGINQQGGHQEYLVIDQTALVDLPTDLNMTDAELAPLMCAGNTVYTALTNANVKAGDIVIVQGLGGLGHLALQYAKDLALKLGAHHYISSKEDVTKEMEKIGQAKAIIATAPSGKAPAQLLPLLSNYGTLCIVGAPADGSKLEVDTMVMISKFARIQGIACGSAASNDSVAKFSSQAGIKSMVKEWSLDQLQEAVSSRLRWAGVKIQ